MSIVSLQTPIREGLKIPRANAHPGSNPGSGTINEATKDGWIPGSRFGLPVNSGCSLQER
jgi:hypothetical protein